MKAFTPAKIKADLVFVGSLIATFGFNLPDSVAVAVVGSSALIAASLNVGESLLEKYAPTLIPSVVGEVKTLEGDATKLLPLILPVIESLPGKIGVEVKQAIEALEHGPAAVTTPAANSIPQ